MPNLRDLINRIDNFVLNVVPDQNIPYQTKRDMGKILLSQAENAYPGLDFHARSLLAERILNLRKILHRWIKQESSSQEDELVNLVRYLKALIKLAGANPTPEQNAEIRRIQIRIRQLRQALPDPLREYGLIAIDTETPPELKAAQQFRERMEHKTFFDETSMKVAIANTQEEIKKLELYWGNLTFDLDQMWGSQAVDEISKLSALVGEWNDQLGNIKRQEGLARTWQWQIDRDRERTRSYVEHKTSEIAKGQQKIEAAKVLRDATNELEKAFSLCQMLMSKAHTLATPDIIPIDKMDASIRTFEGILSGLGGRLTEGEIREATRFLNRAKAYRSEMAKSLETLGYKKGMETYETTRVSEGLRYFQANLPGIVREILSARTIKQLEGLASSGVNGAKEAIAQAIIMAGKQNPDRMRAYIMGR